MENRFVLIGKFEVRHELINDFLEAVDKAIVPTRKELGCVSYKLHQDIKSSNVFMFYEIWESYEDWKAHDNALHITEFRKVLDRCVISVTFNQLKEL